MSLSFIYPLIHIILSSDIQTNEKHAPLGLMVPNGGASW